MWQEGRQGTGYFKKLLFQYNLCECWLVRYPPNTHIPPHIDKISNKRHYRLNIVLKGNGDFKSESCIINLKRIVLFRPDVNIHSMANGNTERLILSFGLALKEK